MIKTIIIDDEPLARSIILEYLAKYTDIEVLAECSDGFEGVKKIEELRPDLIFLDIQMPKITGFEMLELLDYHPMVIFVTAFDQYAIQAFDAHAIDYLLKPFDEERFAKAISKLNTNYQAQNTQKETLDSMAEDMKLSGAVSNRVVVKVKDNIKIIPSTNIKYIEAAGDFVKLITNEGVFLKSKTMAYFENNLDPAQFVRIHRSFLLNINELTRLELYEKENYLAILKDNQKLSVSKAGYAKLKQIMGI